MSGEVETSMPTPAADLLADIEAKHQRAKDTTLDLRAAVRNTEAHLDHLRRVLALEQQVRDGLVTTLDAARDLASIEASA